jgi:hypothetical protein
MEPGPSLRDLLERAIAAQRALADIGEDVEDEWTYVNDLHDAWAARLAEVAVSRGTEPASPAMIAAIEQAIAETEAGLDPHRAIDWLSTFPQVVLLAVGDPG